MEDFVKVINRTPKPLEFQYDGRAYVIDKEKILPAVIARHGLKRNPIMGTNGNESKLGIEGITDCTPLVDLKESNERVNREELALTDPNAKKVESLSFSNVEANSEFRQRAKSDNRAITYIPQS